MDYNNAAIIRPDLQQVVEEAVFADRALIATRVFPPLGSKNKSAEYRRIKKTEGEVLAMEPSARTLRAPNAEPQEVTRTYAKDNFTCKEYALIEKVDDTVAAEVSASFDAEVMASKFVGRNLMFGLEQRVANVVQDPNVWGAAATPTVNYTYTNIATVNFAADLKKALRKIKNRGEMANTLIMTGDLWDLISQTTLLRQYFYGSNGGNQMINQGDFAAKFELENFLVAESTSTTSVPKGKTVTDATITNIWSNASMWVGSVAGGDYANGGAGRTIYWEQAVSDLLEMMTYRDEPKVSDVVRGRMYTAEKAVNENCGTLITTNFSLS